MDCEICTKPQGKIIDGICEECADTIEHYTKTGCINMNHAPYMKVQFYNGVVYKPLTYSDLKEIIKD